MNVAAAAGGAPPAAGSGGRPAAPRAVVDFAAALGHIRGHRVRDEAAAAMTSPEHERARLLEAAIDRAVDVLGAPITRIEVRGDEVLCSAGPRTLTMSYGYEAARDGTGASLPGCGRWWVAVDRDRVAGEAEVATALGRAAGRWLRSWSSAGGRG